MTCSQPDPTKSTVRRRFGAGIFVVVLTLVLGSGGVLSVAEQIGSKVAAAAQSLADSDPGQKHRNPEMALVQALLSPVPSSDPTLPFTPSAGTVLAAVEPAETVGGIAGEGEAERLPETAVETPPASVPVEEPGSAPRDKAPQPAAEPGPQPVTEVPPAVPVDVPADVPSKPVSPADPPTPAPLLPAQPGEKTVLKAPPAGVSNLLPEAARFAQQGRPVAGPRDAGTGAGAKAGLTEPRR